MYEELNALLIKLAEGQIRTDALIAKLTEGQIRTDQSINELTLTVTRYVDASDARAKRIEDNLDALIRAITREHGNGKGGH